MSDYDSSYITELLLKVEVLLNDEEYEGGGMSGGGRSWNWIFVVLVNEE